MKRRQRPQDAAGQLEHLKRWIEALDIEIDVSQPSTEWIESARTRSGRRVKYPLFILTGETIPAGRAPMTFSRAVDFLAGVTAAVQMRRVDRNIGRRFRMRQTLKAFNNG